METDSGTWPARAVISATGTWWRPFLLAVPGRGDFGGRPLHTVEYRSPKEFFGLHVIVVGGGNSGAQIAADLVAARHPGGQAAAGAMVSNLPIAASMDGSTR